MVYELGDGGGVEFFVGDVEGGDSGKVGGWFIFIEVGDGVVGGDVEVEFF